MKREKQEAIPLFTSQGPDSFYKAENYLFRIHKFPQIPDLGVHLFIQQILSTVCVPGTILLAGNMIPTQVS